MIKVVLFASVREAVGQSSVEVDPAQANTVMDVIRVLGNKGSTWQAALSAENLLTAVNQTLVESGHPVQDGDEVALFPPVTGG